MPMLPLVPLSVLDLSPVSAGESAASALQNSVALAVSAESAGYSRFWLAEHHLSSGVAGSAPHVLSGIIAAATSTIRVGTAATIVGNYRPLQVAENVGTVAALYPGRIDLGFGRSGAPTPPVATPIVEAAGKTNAGPESAANAAGSTVVDGLVVPPPPLLFADGIPERLLIQAALLGQTSEGSNSFENDVQGILAFFAGTYRTPQGMDVTATPAASLAPEFWIHGSSAGVSARLAGKLGLPFGAAYHVAPSAVLAAIAEYRAHFKPSAVLTAPYVAVSADVLVAPTEERARTIGAGYAAWVHSARTSQGAIPYPAPEEAATLDQLNAAQAQLVQDRLDTRFVGDPAQVVTGLRTLQRVTGANEILTTSIAHSHSHRVQSQELLAEAWGL